jgi:asparagine synthase (glutamine-hydrolyzing)
MCGITGIAVEVAMRLQESLKRMTSSLAHRGPDGEGTAFFDSCALGHRRLAIVDIAGGSQPMFSPERDVAVVLNGEIYGYQQLRETLDYPFRTNSDTEILLALYERYGLDMVRHLPGMFAFALWDDKKKLLLCARDRFGEKPFFYAPCAQGGLIFASEIKALLASELLPPQRLNYSALGHYLKHLCVPVTQSIFSGIVPLPPAHQLVFCQNKLSVSRYWDFPAPQSKATLADSVEQFSDLFSTAVRRQLVADVDVAAFLSGGLDSSSVVCAAVRHKPDLRTMAYGFCEGVDERPFALEAAQLYHTRHEELHDGQLDLPALLEKMADVFDEPFADSSNIPTYLISRQAVKHARVVLTGDGGDELLAGYDGVYRDLLLKTSRFKVRFRAALTLFRRACENAVRMRRDALRCLRQSGAVLRGISNVASHRYNGGYFPDRELKAFSFEDVPLLPTLHGGLDDALRLDVANYMPADILVKTDRASMANGLELRAPFLDVDVASFLLALPTTLKIDDRHSKILLREAFGAKWPPSFVHRDKVGFGAPVHWWLQKEGMTEFCRQYFKPDRLIHQILPDGFVERYAHQCNYQCWILLVLSVWLEKYAKYIAL